MNKVNSGYIIWDPREFPNIEEANRELNRLRAICIRLKKKQEEKIDFLIGVSVTDSGFCGCGFGEIGYDKQKRLGGKKQFLCTGRLKKKDLKTGEVIKVIPQYVKKPHIHFMAYGYGASSCAQHVLINMRKANNGGRFIKSRLDSPERIAGEIQYITNQCSILRHV